MKRFMHGPGTVSRSLVTYCRALTTESVYIVDFAHAGINRQKAAFAINEDQGFQHGSRLTIETSVAKDRARSRQKVGYRQAPNKDYNGSRRDFKSRLTALPSLSEWSQYLQSRKVDLTVDEQQDISWSLINASNSIERTAKSDWWQGVADEKLAAGQSAPWSATLSTLSSWKDRLSKWVW